MCDLIEIGKSLILIFGRDEGLLESAAMRPQTIIYGEDAYPTFEDKVASSSLLARNHALIDGNKRISLVCWSYFLPHEWSRFKNVG